MKDDQNLWNIVYSLFFVLVAYALLRTLYVANGGLPTSIGVFDSIILALATFRLTRLFVYDKITRFLRDLFQHTDEEYTQEGVTYFRKTERTNGPLRTAYELLICPWCFSIWAALFVSFFYYLTPLAWLPIFIIALSGVATAIQIVVNMIGWTAENRKLEANSRS